MDIKISRNYIIGSIGLSLLFLMMGFISQFNLLKVGLMFLLLILIRKIPANLSKNVRVAYLLIILYGIYGIFFGLLYQNPNPFLYVTIYCIYPVFFAFFSLFLIKDNYFIKIVQIIFLAHFFINQ